MTIQKLLDVLKPPSQPAEVGNPDSWVDLEKNINSLLPSDYKSFLSHYGTGWVGHFIIIWNPFAENDYVNYIYRLNEFLTDVKMTKQDRPVSEIDDLFPLPFFPDEAGLLPFGSSVNGDTFFWRTNGKPKEWRIAINRIRSSNYEIHDMSLVDFIYNLQLAKLDTFIKKTNFDPKLGFEQKFIGKKRQIL